MNRINIAVDAMGGDLYPKSPVLASLMAIPKYPDINIILLGDKKIINNELSQKSVAIDYEKHRQRIKIVDAPEIVPMGMKDPKKVMKLPKSSIFIGTDMLKSGEVDAFISAGDTGAVMGTSLLRVGRIEGIKRPAIALVLPTENGPCVNLDVGANASNNPFHLAQFSIMGSIYAREICGINNPKVGLMSVGEEKSKGNDLVKIANENLEILHKKNFINFLGNVEGSDMLAGTADVIVVDAFTGNVVLKFAEGIIPLLKGKAKTKLDNSNVFTKLRIALGGLLLKPLIDSVKKDLNYEEYGGAPLLGIAGVVIIAHGKSSPLALMHAIRVGRQAALEKMVDKITVAIRDIPTNLFNEKPDSQ